MLAVSSSSTAHHMYTVQTRQFLLILAIVPTAVALGDATPECHATCLPLVQQTTCTQTHQSSPLFLQLLPLATPRLSVTQHVFL